ncbi:uncharacterized protein At4g04775-like [Arachis ipaensis]|uniref:uncharacterized protein At4g04775-like n=1 Tax=Arachis ipaensis TaxID=130454 RepID=UPI000A2B4B33|nr:uncharacterized protein At4g04775-like [Arachis ipaensis]XP_025628222.1 uncharacterized protein At4g04775-like [Arachis hypogaea]
MNFQIGGDNLSCNMNSSESIGVRRKKRWFSPKCYCGSHAILFMSGTENNPDRLFFRCPYFKTIEVHCSFFAWLDDYVASFNEYAGKTMSKGVLLQKQNPFEGESDAMDDKVKKLEDRLIGLENELEKCRLKTSGTAIISTNIVLPVVLRVAVPATGLVP